MSAPTRESYLGWAELRHRDSCKRPVWTVDVKTEPAVRRRNINSTAPHACPDEECGHGPTLNETTVRIVCPSCGAVVIVRNEHGLKQMSTRHLGYGLPPRRLSGLLLWPGEPYINVGRLNSDEPHDFIVTRPGVTRPVRDDLVGEIGQSRTQRGAVRYHALAGLSPDGQYGYGDVRWTVATEGLRTVAAAAKWIASNQ